MFGDFFKYISILMQVLSVKDKVQENLRTNGSVKELLSEAGPGVLDLIKQVGATFFPEVAGEDKQIQAAAMKVYDLDYVKGVQAALNKAGAEPKLKIDGDYGKKTKKAAEEFQKKHKIEPADGWVGPKTNAVLQAESAGKV